jgi:hypothetical protein
MFQGVRTTMIDHLMTQLNRLLKASLEIMLPLGTDQDDDVWDEYTEVAFEGVVAVPLMKRSAIQIDWVYGESWSPAKVPPKLIWAKVQPCVALVGVREADSGEVKTYKYEEVALEHSLMLAFVAFRHPFLAMNQAEQLDHVFGSVLDEQQGIVAGSDICVPLEHCEFTLER